MERAFWQTPLFLIRTAVQALTHHKGRSFLTILSIIVGIGALVGTISIGNGAQKKLAQKLKLFGKNTVQIQTGNILSQGKTDKKKKGTIKTLSVSDLKHITHMCPEIEHTSPLLRIQRSQVSYRNKYISTTLNGVGVHYFSITNKKLSAGISFTQHHITSRRNVAVIGSAVARELFGTLSPLKKQIRIKKQLFTVIGVIDQMENIGPFHDKNMEVWLPFSTAGHKLTRIPAHLMHGIILNTYRFEDIEHVERKLKRTMRARHQLSTNDPDDFTIWNQYAMAAAARESSSLFLLFFMIVASLSLLVGGIGVMNIMLVSVTERTKEIGIRQAIGAPPALIIAQFLVESVILCLTGGILGILAGIALPYLIAPYTGWQVLITLNSLLLALGVTTLVGIIFGLYPAWRATQIPLVDALIDS